MRMLGLALFGLIVAAGVGGGAWVYRTQQAAAEAAALAEPPPQEPLAPPSVESSTPVPTETKPVDLPSTDESLPVVERPRSFSPEELVSWAMALKKREAAILEREEALQRIELRQKLVHADIEGEQTSLEGLFQQSRDQRSDVETLLKTADESLQALAARTTEYKKMQEAATATAGQVGDRDANVEKMALVVQGMDPDKAAQMLKGLANEGKIDMAVQLLHKMEEKRASAVIEALKDPPLISEVLEMYLEMKTPKPAAKGRR